ncbi:hypothetical protein ACQUW5_00635 [Legionella sp. CNM-1927-20]|uniref:hypothetical protein n=1 Tax=Legionella sp. CNM-1927-20 TaxID=3422221 RepID=UPI00403ACCDF
MYSKFFTNTIDSDTTAGVAGVGAAGRNNLQYFLENFPELEFWRFFIERGRFDFRQYIYHTLFSKLQSVPMEQAKLVPVEEIKKSISSLTVGSLYEMANGDEEMLGWLKRFRLENRKSEILVDVINMQQGWIGFEETEPGYLLHVTRGLATVLSSVVEREPLSLEFIKRLHKISTEKVENMLEQTSGEFRCRPALWLLVKEADSLAGLIESINYLKEVTKRHGKSQFEFRNATKSEPIGNLGQDSEELAALLWEEKNRQEIYFYAGGRSIDNIEDFLNTIGEEQINELKAQLKVAKTKEEKLTAIFSYLKYAVLFHPFQDGVGRTYSMLLSQYLLMQENLLPVLLVNSNIIPGYSVEELVTEYMRAENEMEKILQNPSYVASGEFSNPNIETLKLNALSPSKEVIFDTCLKIYQEAKFTCLQRLVEAEAPLTSSYMNIKN